MTQPINTEEAIGVALRWLEKYLPGELEAQKRPLRDFSGGWLKASRSGILTRDGKIDQDRMDTLIAAAAAGDEHAFGQVASIAIWFLLTERPLPESFRRLEISLWSGKLPKLKPRKIGRDIQYGLVIYILQQDYGFKPTRNRATHGETDATESGCSILSKALARMGQSVPEQTLEKIWEKNAWRR
ncbi:hypothetical protein [Rhizobium azibense]|uniref:Uncharacterized protein n=1 Tax=Rhizobium azibense TaxID=1136135 RepID=A0A4R3RVF8_9HYPH|nr:hypothetical protein [Rhizobium azibense]TCU38767.1 hypothetical protein EV129_104374 [Rhizobium azibense]